MDELKERVVWVPVMYGVLVHGSSDSEDAENSARELIMDLTEEVWDETFEANGNVLDFIGFEWLNGMFTEEQRVLEVTRDDAEAAQDGSGEAG